MKTWIVLMAALVAPVAFAQQQAGKPVAAPAAAEQGQGADAMFAAWDANHDGSISKDEFRAGFVQVRDALTVQRLHAEFERRDANHDGKLQASEYAQMMLVQRAGKNAPPMSAFDKDKNQSLDFPEYLDALKTLAKSQPATAAPKK
ncbi:hypothetical protein LYSHEL_08950 [Lysobacter helvus]|uniref:EF-hand domain-containing protein n=2 Tax=Lysobacteraceae TaxID=32033 RepID=A0ABN6FQG3_9GAMM|nr:MULTISPECIES: EF-hand domain-containing protein [Lysobacter]BCT91871.1 hypothetical protein LYSCAS_08950 [Lysobacter caseinilyticus]BCT95024.1 hypothetical protein LYSHEL_08950 [Lysobacter helvus]